MKFSHPTEAIIAVTLNCNARCVMCDIWKNKIKGEVEPDIFLKLPPTLTTINITGGEPFLRNDLPNIVKNMKKACPKARLIINTNGYLTAQIKKIVPLLLKIDPHLALRVSLDGMGKMHDEIRRLPFFYEKAMESLAFCREAGVKDLGISYTLMEKNKRDLIPLFEFCEENKYEFSLTVATDSPIYFGEGKMKLRPAVNNELKTIFNALVSKQYRSRSLKNWIRAWFNKRLLEYMEKGKRRYSCRAGTEFFYMDSLGKIFVCHIKPWIMGDLTRESFKEIFSDKRISLYMQKTSKCNDCWMVCSARANIKNNKLRIARDIIVDQIHLLGKPDI